MKPIHLIAALFFTLLALDGNAQIYWIGNAPGHENDWNYHQNWSKYRVPTAFDDVIIPDVGPKGNQYPVIDAEATVNSLYITSNARITIQASGKLIIEGQDAYEQGILNLGTLRNDGVLQIHNQGLSPLNNYEGNGRIEIKDVHFAAAFERNE